MEASFFQAGVIRVLILIVQQGKVKRKARPFFREIRRSHSLQKLDIAALVQFQYNLVPFGISGIDKDIDGATGWVFERELNASRIAFEAIHTMRARVFPYGMRVVCSGMAPGLQQKLSIDFCDGG